MLFQKRVDRAMEHSKAHSRGQEYDSRTDREEPELKDVMEKGDGFAMLVAALITFLPICLLLLLIMAGAGALFFLL